MLIIKVTTTNNRKKIRMALVVWTVCKQLLWHGKNHRLKDQLRTATGAVLLICHRLPGYTFLAILVT